MKRTKLARIASKIRSRLYALKDLRQKQVQERLQNLIGEFDRFKQIHKKLGLCNARGFHTAAAKTIREAEGALYDLHYYKQDTERVIRPCQIPTLREIYHELYQAKEEFGSLGYEEGRLSVTTEPIELEGIYLGEFEIQLILSRIGQNDAFHVVAVDPHPAAGNESVTHPHVQDERLCPGDGGAAIYNAITTGRIFDFFTLVRSILTHYNSGSPFIALSDWEGRRCGECGYSMGEPYYCHTCETDICDECAYSCQACEDTTCPSCLKTCQVCDKGCCSSCITECPDCGDALCLTGVSE